MTLNELKKEYKKSISSENMDEEDYDQLIDEIDEVQTLEDFIQVAGLWATPKNGERNTEHIILNRLLDTL